MTPILELRNLSRHFGGVNALDGVTLSVGENEVVGLIGPNGAGKTTLVNVVTGVHAPSGGEVHFCGERIDGLRSDRIARRGIARTFQIVQPFPRLTVLDNVAAGILFSRRASSLSRARDLAAEYLAFTGLYEACNQVAATLTLAGRKRLELAKSLATDPKLLFLDEVNAGLNTAEIDAALELIGRIAARGITIVLIEHVMKVVRRACRRVIVLHQGKVLADGPTGSVLADRRVVDAYLGARAVPPAQAGAIA